MMGEAMRALRSLAIQSGRFSPGEVASLDRSVAAADEFDVQSTMLEVTVRDALAAMDAFIAAAFDGLSDAEAVELDVDDSMATIMGVRDTLADPPWSLE